MDEAEYLSRLRFADLHLLARAHRLRTGRGGGGHLTKPRPGLLHSRFSYMRAPKLNYSGFNM